MATTPYIFEVRSSGALQAGLTPTWSTLRKLSDGTTVASPGTVAVISELGGGLYKVAYDPEGANGELVGVLDAGAGITSAADRYITMVLAQDSSRVARLDATIASRSSHTAADVWAVGTRSLTTFGTLVSDIWSNASRTLTAIADSSGVTTLLSRLTNTRATLLDNLAFLTAAPPTSGQIAAAIPSAVLRYGTMVSTYSEAQSVLQDFSVNAGEDTWIESKVVDEDGRAVPLDAYTLTVGLTGSGGFTQSLDNTEVVKVVDSNGANIDGRYRWRAHGALTSVARRNVRHTLTMSGGAGNVRTALTRVQVEG